MGDPEVAIEVASFVQEPYRQSAEFAEVREVAEALLARLREPEAVSLIAEANRPGNSSWLVQAAILGPAEELGFVSESNGLFAEYATSGLRPDYFRRIGDTGILLEVERGKTTINNMDLLDFWKCHLCGYANYLLLMVPRELRQNETMSPRREFATVVKRLESFFVPGNYTNVRGLYVFGY